jgi:nucleoside 2-deoxyribosyltransferase
VSDDAPGRGRRVYLAGPEVFLPTAAEVLAAKAECARALGFAPVLPVDESHPGTGHDVATRIYEGNRARIAESDLLVANLSPFRGPSADPGTVFELGYAAALGRPVHAYTTDPRVLADRVPWLKGADGALRDRDGLLVEDFGRAENLMPVVACERSGAAVVVAPGGDALAGLRACLRAAGG